MKNGTGRAGARRKAERRAIDAILRQAYGDIVNEPVPDMLRAVLAQDEAQSATKT